MMKFLLKINKYKFFAFLYVLAFLVLTSHYLLSRYEEKATFIDSWSSLVIKQNWSDENLKFQENKFLQGDSISSSFKSNYSNLGTLAIYFDNNEKINIGNIELTLKDDDNNKVVYSKIYPIDKINSAYPYTFGFPLINDSKGVNYSFSIISTDGVEEEALNLNHQVHYLIKHVYSLNDLRGNPLLLLELIAAKSSEFFEPLSTNLFSYLLLFLTGYLSLISLIYILQRINFSFLKDIHHIYPYILFFLTLIVAGYFSTLGADPHHDGILLKPAIDVLNGKVLFRETFSQYGILTVYLQAISMKLFGEYLIVIRLLTALFYALISVLLYFIWNRILPKSLSFLSGIVYILLAPYFYFTFLPWASVYALFFQLLVVYCFLQFSSKKDIKYLYLAGFLTGVTFWFKQNIGIYVGIPSLLLILFIFDFSNLKKRLYSLKYFIIGGLFAAVPVLLFILIQNSQLDWFKQSFLYAASWAKYFGKKNGFWHSLFGVSKSTISIWTFMPLVTILLFLRELVNKKVKGNENLLIISFFSLFSWLQYYPISDIRHHYWAASIMIGLFTYFVWNFIPKMISGKKIKILPFLSILIILPLFFYHDINFRIIHGLRKTRIKYVTINRQNILSHMKFNQQDANKFTHFHDVINAYLVRFPDSNIVTIGPDAMFLLFGNSENFHPMYVSWSTINNSIYRDYPMVMNSYIDHNKPIVISFDKHLVEGYCPISDLQYKTKIIVPCPNIIK